MRILLAALVVTSLVSPDIKAESPAEESAVSTVKSFQSALLAHMHHDPSRLADAIRSTFNVHVMSAFIAGPAWASASPTEQTTATSAFTRYLVARFAHEFDNDEGQRFRIAPTVQSRGQDRLIQTEVTQTGSIPVHLDYRLRAYEGQWRIIDVYYDGVSQLATQRADVAQSAPQVAALATHFDEAASALR